MKVALAIAVLVAVPALAEVKSSSDAGFEVARSITVSATPAEVYAALGRVGQWWSSAHSYSGDARNLTMPLRVGACFCEAVPKGGGMVEHGRVIYLQPGQTLRLSAALGPLQAEGAVGTLTWSLKAVPGGTEIAQSYVVGGYVRGGAGRFAAAVDGVMNEQLSRLQSHIEAPKPLSKRR
jgi:uncharacterized protein YndB with AHSA1/START domain